MAIGDPEVLSWRDQWMTAAAAMAAVGYSALMLWLGTRRSRKGGGDRDG